MPEGDAAAAAATFIADLQICFHEEAILKSITEFKANGGGGTEQLDAPTMARAVSACMSSYRTYLLEQLSFHFDGPFPCTFLGQVAEAGQSSYEKEQLVESLVKVSSSLPPTFKRWCSL